MMNMSMSVNIRKNEVNGILKEQETVFSATSRLPTKQIASLYHRIVNSYYCLHSTPSLLQSFALWSNGFYNKNRNNNNNQTAIIIMSSWCEQAAGFYILSCHTIYACIWLQQEGLSLSPVNGKHKLLCAQVRTSLQYVRIGSLHQRQAITHSDSAAIFGQGSKYMALSSLCLS